MIARLLSPFRDLLDARTLARTVHRLEAQRNALDRLAQGLHGEVERLKAVVAENATTALPPVPRDPEHVPTGVIGHVWMRWCALAAGPLRTDAEEAELAHLAAMLRAVGAHPSWEAVPREEMPPYPGDEQPARPAPRAVAAALDVAPPLNSFGAPPVPDCAALLGRHVVGRAAHDAGACDVRRDLPPEPGVCPAPDPLWLRCATDGTRLVVTDRRGPWTDLMLAEWIRDYRPARPGVWTWSGRADPEPDPAVGWWDFKGTWTEEAAR